MMELLAPGLLWSSVGFLIFAAITSWRGKQKRTKRWQEQIAIRDFERRQELRYEAEKRKAKATERLNELGIPTVFIEDVVEGILHEKGLLK